MRPIHCSTIVFVTLSALVVPKLSAKDASLKLESGTQKVSLIELYTSEGCSSCPPAERWLNTLGDNNKLWKNFVPIAFHVDYWDYLGWKDIFSTAEASARQHDYAKFWGNNSVFTPAIVRDGELLRKWSRDLDSSTAKAPNIVLTVSAQRDWTIEAQGQSLDSLKCLEATVATLDRKTSSRVTAGENKGETLVHSFSALKWQTKRLNRESSSWRILGSLGKEGNAVAAWISECGSPAPLQAVGGMR